MDEKKPEKRGGARPGAGRPKGTAARRLGAAFTVKCTPEYKVWLQSLAAHQKGEMADVFREALRHYAESCRFRKPPLR